MGPAKVGVRWARAWRGRGGDSESEWTSNNEWRLRLRVSNKCPSEQGRPVRAETSRAKSPNFRLRRESERKRKEKLETHKNRTHRYHIYYLDSQAGSSNVVVWLVRLARALGQVRCRDRFKFRASHYIEEMRTRASVTFGFE